MNVGWRSWWAFALLCLIAASRWVIADQWPLLGSTLRSEGLGCLVVAVLFRGCGVGAEASGAAMGGGVESDACGRGFVGGAGGGSGFAWGGE